MNMIEKVALAIGPMIEADNEIYWAAEYGRPIPAGSIKRIAKAAIEAMREPSEGMNKAGWLSHMPRSPSFPVDDMWQAMIDAALSEDK